MNLRRPLILLSLCATAAASAAPARFIADLEAGKPQRIVIFGTSLSKSGAWVDQMQSALETRFPGLVSLTNGARGGKNSEWGRENVDANVIAHRPDVVFIEFAINDAVARYHLSRDRVRENVDFILDRISKEAPKCEIILQVMNPVVGKSESDPGYRRDQDAYQQIYRDAAKKRGLLLIDHSIAWNALLQSAGVTGYRKHVPDGVHPNAAGYATYVTPAILEAIGFPSKF